MNNEKELLDDLKKVHRKLSELINSYRLNGKFITELESIVVDERNIYELIIYLEQYHNQPEEVL